MHSGVHSKLKQRSIPWATEQCGHGGSLIETQCGFHQGRGPWDQLFSLQVQMGKAREFHKPIYICLIDPRKAYNSEQKFSLDCVTAFLHIGEILGWSNFDEIGIKFSIAPHSLQQQK